MKDQFVPCETAKTLKELGFNEKCFEAHCDYGDGKNKLSHMINTNSEHLKYKNNFSSAPTWHQVENWLWEGHRVYTVIHITSWDSFYWVNYKSGKGMNYAEGDLKYSSPIETKIEGIKAAVKYLYENK